MDYYKKIFAEIYFPFGIGISESKSRIYDLNDDENYNKDILLNLNYGISFILNYNFLIMIRNVKSSKLVNTENDFVKTYNNLNIYLNYLYSL